MEIGNWITIALFFIVQITGFAAWINKLTSRLTAIEVRNGSIDKTTIVNDLNVRVSKLETKSDTNDTILMEIKASLIRIEERLNASNRHNDDHKN